MPALAQNMASARNMPFSSGEKNHATETKETKRRASVLKIGRLMYLAILILLPKV